MGDPGDWAEADGRLADGRSGPAQLSYGWGLTRYKEEIDRLEAKRSGIGGAEMDGFEVWRNPELDRGFRNDFDRGMC